MWGNLAKDKKECVELGSIAWDVLGVRCVFVCWNGWMSEWTGVAEPLSDSSLAPLSSSGVFRSPVAQAL